MALKIYFAGPNVFHLKAKEMEQEIETYCRSIGIEPLIPGDTGVDWNNPDSTLIAKQIFDINADHLRNCDAVIANVTPFRGACVDDGTSWEIGFAHALGKPVFTYGWGPQTTAEAIEMHAGKDPSYSHPSRDNNGDLIEDFGLQNNLMIACSTADHIHLEFTGYDSIVEAIKPLVDAAINHFSNQ